MAEEVRLDKLLLDKGIATSRQKAVGLIKEGLVKVDEETILKPGRKVSTESTLLVSGEEMPWVSRGALKLIEALDHWRIEVEHKTCLDVGASTGGFTEVLLTRGARKILAVDTGRDQLAEKLRDHERVVNLEKTDVRQLDKSIVEPVDVVVIDVSFISLKLVLPAIIPFLKENSEVVALIKPQFEVGRENVGKNGIVKSGELHQKAVSTIADAAVLLGLKPIGVINSPITGGDGNKEFLLYARFEANKNSIDLKI